jgi:catechol 2,3-dioxygenase-like lactoylglutathione lyase family enzyme
MKSTISHLVINVKPENLPFYKGLLLFLGWKVLFEEGEFLGLECEGGSSLWFGAGLKDLDNDYDGRGMNHLAIGVDSQTEVDQVVDYLKEKMVKALFETPRHRPEFSSPGNTYYQVMFESPDRVLFEVVYIGVKQ